jgi:transcriptional regulator with XRE-family HTH domain
MTTRERAQQIATSLDDKAYSEAFVEAEIATTIPFQIRALRRERNWTQTDLANETGQHQKTISDFENPDIGPGSITSLRKIAAAFDVALIVRFAPFSDLVDWSARMTKASHFVPSRIKDAKLLLQRNGTRGHAPVEASTLLQMYFDGFGKQDTQTPQTVARMLEWKARPKRDLTSSGGTLSNADIVNQRAQAS